MDASLATLLTLTSLLSGCLCLRSVSLVILPPAVEKGGSVTLLCRYDLENAPLYAVKWYRGTREFYRFSPNDHPPTKIFPYKGIHVDLSQSNASQVVLQGVGFDLSGNMSCEVTTDSPTFSTSLVFKQLMVIQVPQGGPVINTEKARYYSGDTLRANCTTQPSRPPAQITFYINDMTIEGSVERAGEGPGGLASTILTVDTRLNSSILPGGPVLLKCLALVGTYQLTAQLNVGQRTTEPVPERVTSPSRSTRVLPFCLPLLIVLSLLTR